MESPERGFRLVSDCNQLAKVTSKLEVLNEKITKKIGKMRIKEVSIITCQMWRVCDNCVIILSSMNDLLFLKLNYLNAGSLLSTYFFPIFISW